MKTDRIRYDGERNDFIWPVSDVDRTFLEILVDKQVKKSLPEWVTSGFPHYRDDGTFEVGLTMQDAQGNIITENGRYAVSPLCDVTALSTPWGLWKGRPAIHKSRETTEVMSG